MFNIIKCKQFIGEGRIQNVVIILSPAVFDMHHHRYGTGTILHITGLGRFDVRITLRIAQKIIFLSNLPLP